jgi:tetratricopeptide (TPR) repeat protein
MVRLTSQLLCAAILAFVATASPVRVAVAQASGDDDRDDAQARELFLEGDEAYAEADYERAATLFMRAYELSGRPALLFNLGNAYERMGAYDRAAEALQRYLDSPEARDREVIERRIARLEEAHRRRVEEIARLEAAGPETAAPAQAGAGEASGGERRAYWWLSGGGAAVAGGLIFGLASHASGNQAARRCAEEDGALLCPGSARSALSRERGFAIAADVSTVLGLGAASVGGYLLWKQRRGEPQAGGFAIAPAVLPEALGVGVRGAF